MTCIRAMTGGSVHSGLCATIGRRPTWPWRRSSRWSVIGQQAIWAGPAGTITIDINVDINCPAVSSRSRCALARPPAQTVVCIRRRRPLRAGYRGQAGCAQAQIPRRVQKCISRSPGAAGHRHATPDRGDRNRLCALWVCTYIIHRRGTTWTWMSIGLLVDRPTDRPIVAVVTRAPEGLRAESERDAGCR